MRNPNDIRDWVIYKITSPSDRVYIGKSVSFPERLRNYKCHKAKTQPILNNSLIKYGFENHKIEIIDTFSSNCDYAAGKEIFWIRSFMCNYAKYPQQRGMNVTDGGEGILGSKKSEEERLRMRERNLGKKMSPESSAKKSKSMMGKNVGKGVGRKLSLEHRNKISERLKGVRYTDEKKLRYKNSQTYKRKPIIQTDLDGNFVKYFESLHMAGKELPISPSNIWKVLKGKIKTSGGFKFKYA